MLFFFFSSRRRHTMSTRDWSSDVCSSDLEVLAPGLLRVRVVVVGGLVQGDLADLAAESYGRPHSQGPAGRVAVEERRAAGAVDQRLDVVDLPVDRVGQRVPALAAAAPVKA